MPNEPSYFSTIPGHVFQCKTIEPNAKLLYAEISSLCNRHGYSWATNEYFAATFDVDRSTIVRWLKSLKEHKFIYIETEVEGIQRKRKIWVNKEAKDHFKKMFAKVQKCTDVGAKMHQEGTPSPYIQNNIIEHTSLKVSPSPAAREMSEYLLQKIKRMNPHFSDSTANWPKLFDQMLAKKSLDHLKTLIDWTFNDDFWKTIIVSAGNFKKNLTKIETKWNNPSPPKNSSFISKNSRKSDSKEYSTTSKSTTLDDDMLRPVLRKPMSKEEREEERKGIQDLVEKMLAPYTNGGKKNDTSSSS